MHSRRGRRLLNVTAGVSLALCAATLLLWPRSHRVADYVGWEHASWKDEVYSRTGMSVLSGEGGIGLAFSHYVDRSPSESALEVLRKYDPVGCHVHRETSPAWKRYWWTPPESRHYLGRIMSAASTAERLGFVWQRTHKGLKYDAAVRRAASAGTTLTDFGQVIVGVPAWSVALAFGLLPASRLAGLWRGRRRRGAGLCAHCGYDLRGGIL